MSASERESRPPPIPVREMLEAQGEAAPSEPAASPTREVRIDGEDWLIRVVGATRSGTGQDSGAPLLLLTFARTDAPEAPEREVLWVGASLDRLSPEDLMSAHERSRPIRSDSSTR